MSDVRTQILRREAQSNPNEVAGLWSYIRALERSESEANPGDDYFVPYYLERYKDGEQEWNHCESVYDISFVYLPLIKRYKTLEEMNNHIFGPVPQEDRDPLDYGDAWDKVEGSWGYQLEKLTSGLNEDRVSGYAIIDKAIYDFVETVNYRAPSDGGSDAIANYKTALCVKLAHTNICWRYSLQEKVGDSTANYGYRYDTKWVDISVEKVNK